jgi:hypothetical protein
VTLPNNPLQPTAGGRCEVEFTGISAHRGGSVSQTGVEVCNRVFVTGALTAMVLLCLGCGPTEVPPVPSVANQIQVTDQQASARDASEHVFVSSELYAGFLVALDAQKELWRSKGVELTPRELTARHGKIGCRRDEAGMIQVTFYPLGDVAGGDVTYIVDPNGLKIVKTVFGR